MEQGGYVPYFVAENRKNLLQTLMRQKTALEDS